MTYPTTFSVSLIFDYKGFWDISSRFCRKLERLEIGDLLTSVTWVRFRLLILNSHYWWLSYPCIYFFILNIKVLPIILNFNVQTLNFFWRLIFWLYIESPAEYFLLKGFWNISSRFCRKSERLEIGDLLTSVIWVRFRLLILNSHYWWLSYPCIYFFILNIKILPIILNCNVQTLNFCWRLIFWLYIVSPAEYFLLKGAFVEKRNSNLPLNIAFWVVEPLVLVF